MHWVYKLTYDAGAAPHVRDGLLSLAICKPGIRAKAVPGDWIFGFGGRSRPVMRGERLIYIARVTERLARPGEYYDRAEFRDRWDCVYERQGERLVWRPGSVFHEAPDCSDRDLGPAPVYPKAVVLLSRDFRYLGTNGTFDHARMWPDLATFVHEIGIGQRQVEPASRFGQILSALQVYTWKDAPSGTATRPTEDDGRTPAWSNASLSASTESPRPKRSCAPFRQTSKPSGRCS